MSKLLKPTKLTEKQQILQNVNLFVGIHDLSCTCNQPLKCIVKQIYKQEPTLQFDQKELQQWLTTTAVTATPGGDAETIDGDDLDALFANLDEDATG